MTNDLVQSTNLNPDVTEFETMQRAAKMAVISGFLPNAYQRGDANERIAKAVVVAMKGRELGVPMMQAFSQINVINGKPAISAELMLALIYRAHPKAEISFPVYTDTKCAIKARRPGAEDYTTFEFTIEDAKRAQLVKQGSPWEKYPRAMLRSRAVSEMARSLFPDAIMGCSYTPEELGQEVNEDGEVIEVQNQAVDTKPPQNHHENTQKQPQNNQPAQAQNQPQLEYTTEDIPWDGPENVFDEFPPEKKNTGGEDLGNYVIGFGKNTGTRLMDKDQAFWGKWIDSLEGWITKTPQALEKMGPDKKQRMERDLDVVKKYLGLGEF
jgi:hypothetical protein